MGKTMSAGYFRAPCRILRFCAPEKLDDHPEGHKKAPKGALRPLRPLSHALACPASLEKFDTYH